MSQKPTVAVVGGGPAGLTAAVILKRGGYHVHVYESESSEQQRTQGGTLDLHEDSGQVALQRAGLLEAFRAIARHDDQEERLANHLTGNVVVGHMGPDGEIDKPEIDRGDLRKLLLEAMPADAIRWGHHLERIDAGKKRLHKLVFTNGLQTEVDVVIGADGAWSKVRSFLSASQPIYTGITFFEGWIEQPSEDVAELVGRGTLFCFGGEQAIFAQRNGGGRICVYAALKRANEWLNTQIEQIGLRLLITESYVGWALNLRHLLDMCGDFVRRPIYTLPADFEWAPREGVTVVGDAAHLMPPVGVGVNLAMLDASDVAAAICNSLNWATAIRGAEKAVRERAMAIMPEAINGFQSWFTTDSSLK